MKTSIESANTEAEQAARSQARLLLKAAALTLALIAVAFLLSALRPWEPRTQGKRVSAWLGEIRYFGAPYRQLSPDDPAFVALTNGGPEIAEPLVRIWRRGLRDSRVERWRQDLRELVLPTEQPKSPAARGWCALYVLRHMGPTASNAAPELLRAVAREEGPDRIWAASTLGCIGARPEEAVPRLSAGLDDHDPGMARACAFALGGFGEQAGAALARLQQIRASPIKTQAIWATAAVMLIDPTQHDACLAELIDELRRPPNERDATLTDLLAQIAPPARSAVPALLEIIDQGIAGAIPPHREQAAWIALKRIDPAAHQSAYDERGGDSEDRRWNRER